MALAVKVTADVFVIGDVHGKIDRLEELLAKAGTDERDCTVVQLGDLGHFGDITDDDVMCWKRAREGWIDVVLWGNHDRALVDPRHHFVGYMPGSPAIIIVNEMERQGRVKLAHAAHGWLLTHAGLHASFEKQARDRDLDVERIADWLNEPTIRDDAVVNAVSRERFGTFPYGGILWRDATEPLLDLVPQIFGHSASPVHKVRGERDLWWNIDVGGRPSAADPQANSLCGMWLPSQETVTVGL